MTVVRAVAAELANLFFDGWATTLITIGWLAAGPFALRSAVPEPVLRAPLFFLGLALILTVSTAVTARSR